MSNTPYPVEDKYIQDQDLLGSVTLLAHMRKTPLLLYGIFIEITRQFYSDANDLPIQVSATWQEDPKKTKIWIDSDYRWEDENPELRPAIYIKLNPVEYSTYSGRLTTQISTDLQSGEYFHERLGEGTAQWMHVARTRGESIILAGTTLDYLDSMSTIIRDDFCFDSFEVKNISSIALDKESKERYRTAVTVKFSFQDMWSIKMESPKLKRIVANAGQGLYAGLINH